MRALADLDVLIVDCQTTGASPAFGSVLELGWGIARASRAEIAQLQAHWILLPEGQTVSRQVQKITGYTAALAATAIADRDAWQRMRSAVPHPARVPTAIHYARFELAFLRDWAARFEPEAEFPIDAVCVHALALRLFPELPRQSLRALAGYLGHSLDLARRSLGHVEATAFVWRAACAELATRGITTWEQLQELQAERLPRRARPKKPKYPIASEHYKGLPDEPGVYRFLRRNGDVLYVGKATSLKKRTTSHFAGRTGKELAPEMLTQVADIAVTVVPSALEAALLENQLIKTLRPPYNVQLASNDPRVWYSSRAFDTALPAPDEQHAIGPLPSAYSLRPLRALIALASGALASTALRSEVVGVSDLWTPEPAVFAAGWAEFVRRHPDELGVTNPDVRRAALRVARELLLARVSAQLSASADPLDADASQKPEGWDPERVARHIERAAAQAYQTYRRARWLELLHDSDVEYREPSRPERRRLRIRNGAVELESEAPSSEPGRGEPFFDRAKYDQLRILSSELKRIIRDGGDVAVSRSDGRALPRSLLPGILRLV